MKNDDNNIIETNNLNNNYKTFDNILLSNTYQNNNKELITNNTDYYFEQLTSNQHLVKYKDFEFKLTIPRDNTLDEARFRDKFLKVKLILNGNLTENNFKFVLNYK
jgi:hypothetical protein